ncbi:MAG: UV damage endonuclease UvsE [Pseudomonadota bacterium]|nr:UV damage endonuclease UvsE [Pseudomonadota bacterium]
MDRQDIAPRIGFCCTFISPTGDAEQQRRLNMRHATLASLTRIAAAAAAERLSEIVAHNLDALDGQLAFVASQPPAERMFRILSNFLPGWSHPATMPIYRDAGLHAEIARRLAAAGEYARREAIRLSMHPGPHAVLATARDETLANAARDIAEHVEMMEMLGYGGGWHPHGAHINIHGGSGKLGIDGIRRGLAALPAAARNLLTLENDEMSFGLDDLLPLADEIALVVDFHHHWIRSAGEYLELEDPRLDRVKASWRGIRPAAHISVSRETLCAHWPAADAPDYGALSATGLKATALRGHSDMMWNLAVNDLVARHLSWCDVEVEAKSKNLASAQLAAHVRDRAGGIA